MKLENIGRYKQWIIWALIIAILFLGWQNFQLRRDADTTAEQVLDQTLKNYIPYYLAESYLEQGELDQAMHPMFILHNNLQVAGHVDRSHGEHWRTIAQGVYTAIFRLMDTRSLDADDPDFAQNVSEVMEFLELIRLMIADISLDRGPLEWESEKIEAVAAVAEKIHDDYYGN